MLQEQSREFYPYTQTHMHYSQDYSRFCLHIGHKIEIDPSEWMGLCQDGSLGENIFHLISGIMCRILIIQLLDHMGIQQSLGLNVISLMFANILFMFVKYFLRALTEFLFRYSAHHTTVLVTTSMQSVLVPLRIKMRCSGALNLNVYSGRQTASH